MIINIQYWKTRIATSHEKSVQMLIITDSTKITTHAAICTANSTR